jgi:putative transferase (TIGR04331 family)
LKINLVINPSKEFITKDRQFINLFVDRYTYDKSTDFNKYDRFHESKLDSFTRIQNFKLSDKIFYEILECVRIELNLLHTTNFDLKFYEILLGCWLRHFIQQFIFKYQNIQQIINTNKINYATINQTSEYNFFTTETNTIQDATLNDLWNSCMYSYILENLNLDFELKYFKTNELNFDDSSFISIKKKYSNSKKLAYNFLVNLTNLFPNNAKIFLYHTGFDLLNEKKIDLMFWQLPRFYPLIFEFIYSKFNKILRKKLNFQKYLKENTKNNKDNFVNIFNLIIKILNNSLPIFIVEDFKNLIQYSIRKTNFPKNPKAICTAMAFQNNEPFKFYLAQKKFYNNNVKYFVYQHGGSYITRIDNNFTNEYNTCDKFITWGSKTDLTKNNNVEFANYKLLNKNYFKKKNKSQSKFLIFMRSSGSNTNPYDRYSEGIAQINLVIKLCKNLSDKIKKKTIIRAHYNSKNRINNFTKDLNDFEIDYSVQNYYEAINSAKLVLFNHDSTGMLEMFALNKPTLCLWENIYDHLNAFVSSDYELLVKAKILFDNHEDLQIHLTKVWDDPLVWWNSVNVQKNLKRFVKLYSCLPNKDFCNQFKRIIISK